MALLSLIGPENEFGHVTPCLKRTRRCVRKLSVAVKRRLSVVRSPSDRVSPEDDGARNGKGTPMDLFSLDWHKQKKPRSAQVLPSLSPNGGKLENTFLGVS